MSAKLILVGLAALVLYLFDLAVDWKWAFLCCFAVMIALAFGTHWVFKMNKKARSDIESMRSRFKRLGVGYTDVDNELNGDLGKLMGNLFVLNVAAVVTGILGLVLMYFDFHKNPLNAIALIGVIVLGVIFVGYFSWMLLQEAELLIREKQLAASED